MPANLSGIPTQELEALLFGMPLHLRVASDKLLYELLLRRCGRTMGRCMVLGLSVLGGRADIDLAVGTLWDVVAAAKSGSAVSRQAEY